jgi:hypothetical protein
MVDGIEVEVVEVRMDDILMNEDNAIEVVEVQLGGVVIDDDVEIIEVGIDDVIPPNVDEQVSKYFI